MQFWGVWPSGAYSKYDKTKENKVSQFQYTVYEVCAASTIGVDGQERIKLFFLLFLFIIRMISQPNI